MKVDNGTLNFRVYEDATVFYGMAEVALPEISLLAEEIKGGGIAGAFSGVFMGHTEAMSTTMNFRSVTVDVTRLMEPRNHQIQLLSSQQMWDSAAGVFKEVAVKHLLTGTPSKYNPGKLAPASPTETTVELAVTYFATFIDGVKKTEIDPINCIFFMNGKDWLAQTRRNIGM